MSKEIGQVAFEAYNVSTGGKTYDGKAITPRIQDMRGVRLLGRACSTRRVRVPDLVDVADEESFA